MAMTRVKNYYIYNVENDYSLEGVTMAIQDIRKQDKPTRKRIKEALLTLAESPYQSGVLDIREKCSSCRHAGCT